jgi:hypothetical protein
MVREKLGEIDRITKHNTRLLILNVKERVEPHLNSYFTICPYHHELYLIRLNCMLLCFVPACGTIVVESLALLLYILSVSGSNIGTETRYTKSGFVLPGGFQTIH